MKVTIRKGTFETNSSSVHTLVLAPKESIRYEFDRKKLVHCSVILNPDDTWTLIVPCGDFSDGHGVSSFDEKIRYLCTYIALALTGGYCEDGKDPDLTDEDDSRFGNILKAVHLAEPKIRSLLITHVEKAYFDHQTGPFEEDCVIDLVSEYAIGEFLFNDETRVIFGRD